MLSKSKPEADALTGSSSKRLRGCSAGEAKSVRYLLKGSARLGAFIRQKNSNSLYMVGLSWPKG